MNEELNGFTKLDDSDLENLAGGYLQVSKWRDFVSTQVTPALYRAMDSADASDRNIVSTILSGIQSTMIPNASIAGPLAAIRGTYYSTYRAALHSDSVRSTVDNALNMASNYLSANS